MAKANKFKPNRPWLIYLYGPVTGMTWEQANAWRDRLEKELAPFNIRVINPLRSLKFLKGDGPISGTGRKYREKAIARPAAVIAQNMWDVCRSDVMAGYFIGAKIVSIGSVAEQWIGFSIKKPIIAALDSNEGNPHDHLHVTGNIDITADSLEDLRDKIIAALYGPRYESWQRNLTKKDKRFLKETRKRYETMLKEHGLMKLLKKLEKKSIKRFKRLRKHHVKGG